MGLTSSFAVLQPGLAHQPLLQANCSDSFSGKSYPGLSEVGVRFHLGYPLDTVKKLSGGGVILRLLNKPVSLQKYHYISIL
jgi:hypothetical protein